MIWCLRIVGKQSPMAIEVKTNKPTGFIRRKPCLKLYQSSGVVLHNGTNHILGLHQSRGYLCFRNSPRCIRCNGSCDESRPVDGNDLAFSGKSVKTRRKFRIRQDRVRPGDKILPNPRQNRFFSPGIHTILRLDLLCTPG